MKILKAVAIVILSSIVLLLCFLLYDFYHPVDISKVYKRSRVVTDRDGEWLYTQMNRDDKWRFALDLKKVDPNYIAMLLAFEDKNFYTHFGVDIGAMSRAIWQLISEQRIVSGASTITMQLARLLKPKPRTLLSKLQEIIVALQLELHYSKDEILTYYLTLTPYGGNVEGLVAATMRYFGKLPRSLTAAQSALLVQLPQSPERYRPDRNPKRATKARNRVLKMAYEKALINAYEYNQSLIEPLPRVLKGYPRYAPHLARKILTDKRETSTQIRTTLSSKLQKQLELWAKSKGYRLPDDTTIALLVVENRDASILAYIGSHDLYSPRVSGYIDMIRAIRSPGSTLKPFIYAQGFEKHYIHPNTHIIDQESRFGDYMPYNFSHNFNGEVTIAYALQHSLNIPAVKVLQRVGVEEFIDKISALALDISIPKSRASLPIALGGLGLSMWSLTNLYVTLANGGKSRTLHYLAEDNPPHSIRLFSAKPAKMTTAILRTLPPPEGFINTNQKIAYKTGTSYGYRDNWTVAYTKEYTIAVWVGKPNNATQKRRTGRTIAAPLAFEAFALLESILPTTQWQWHANYLGQLAPQGLQYFDPNRAMKSSHTLKLLYPQEKSRFRSAQCSDVFVEFKLQKGLKPYYWYIDNIPKDINKSTVTIPFDYGSHTIRIIDSRGDMVTRNIWIDRAECCKL